MNHVTSRLSLSVAALLIAALLIAASLIPNLSFAADTAPASKHPSEQAEATDSARDLAVVTNEDGSVSIKVKNVEILHVDEKGIKVNGNIEYTGVTTDTGSLPQEDGDRDDK